MSDMEILGHFNYKNNGTVYIKMGSNMRFGSEAVTYVHELYHERLSNISILGALLKIIGFALEASEKETAKSLDKYADVLVKHTRKVQEVYASSMTWLWLQEDGNEEYKLRYEEIESKEYREYRKILKRVIDDDSKSLQEREKMVEMICQNALFVDSEQFWDSLRDVDEFDEHLETIVNTEARMNWAYENLLEGKDINSHIDVIQVMKKIQSVKIFKGLAKTIKKTEENLPKLLTNEKVIEKYLMKIEEKIKVFEFSSLKVYRNSYDKYKDIDTICIIKRCENLDNKERDFYIIMHTEDNNESVYYSQELSDVSGIVGEYDFVIIPFTEYNKREWKPSYFKTEKPIIVILETYSECLQWGKELLDDGEIFWGDMYAENVNNFFTINFFLKRGKKDVIFLFPTTKKLSIRLQTELGIEKQVLYSRQTEFFKIFGAFHNHINIFKVFRNILAFVLDSTGNSCSDEVFKFMSFEGVNTIINSGMDLYTPNDYFERLMSLPTKQTIGNGRVWILIEYKEGGRIGNIKAETIEIHKDQGVKEIHGILVFNCKMSAMNYIKRNKELEYFYPVEMDMIFWKYFKPILLSKKWIAFLCADGNTNSIEEMIDVERLEYMLYSR